MEAMLVDEHWGAYAPALETVRVALEHAWEVGTEPSTSDRVGSATSTHSQMRRMR
jgi:hypothetical protein